MGESEAGEHWVMMSIFYGMLFALNCRRVTAIVLLQNSRNAALFDFHFLQGILCFLCVFAACWRYEVDEARCHCCREEIYLMHGIDAPNLRWASM